MKKLTLDQIKIESFITAMDESSKRTVIAGENVNGLWGSWFACWFSLACDDKQKPTTGNDCPFTQQPLILACHSPEGRNLSAVDPSWCENGLDEK